MEKEALEIASNSSYSKNATDKDAPLHCNCITAVRYLFQRTTELVIPKGWIGDLPRALLSRKWQILNVGSNEVRCGDLVILKNRISRRSITHITVALAANRFFQCTWKAGKAEIVPCEALHPRYELVSSEETLRFYKDPRNTSKSKCLLL